MIEDFNYQVVQFQKINKPRVSNIPIQKRKPSNNTLQQIYNHKRENPYINATWVFFRKICYCVVTPERNLYNYNF